MKLVYYKNVVSLSIKLAAFQAGSSAYMKRYCFRQDNRINRIFVLSMSVFCPSRLSCQKSTINHFPPGLSTKEKKHN